MTKPRLFSLLSMSLAMLTLFLPCFQCIVQAETTKVTVSSGLPVILRFEETISSRTARVGQTVRMVVQQDVVCEGKTVIKAGTPVNARVANVKKKGVLGAEGRISVIVDSVPAVDGTIVSLGASTQSEGSNQLVLALVLGIILCLPLLLITGTSGEITSGSVANGTIASNVAVTIVEANK
jgi:hypothetical protein